MQVKSSMFLVISTKMAFSDSFSTASQGDWDKPRFLTLALAQPPCPAPQAPVTRTSRRLAPAQGQLGALLCSQGPCPLRMALLVMWLATCIFSGMSSHINFFKSFPDYSFSLPGICPLYRLPGHHLSYFSTTASPVPHPRAGG